MNSMSFDQVLIFTILVVTIALFLWGRWRHDVVALACLLACVLTGLVPAMDAFSGFSHPAVITVACVLILSSGLQATGVVDRLAQRVLPTAAGPTLTIAALTAVGAFSSAFMNNVGAMALLMPVAIQLSRRLGLTAGKVLMPLSFGTILGGMTTLIGTPPNLIVSGFRAESGRDSFGMFDFTPAGLAVAVAGVGLVALVGWRIVPRREVKNLDQFVTGSYFTEARILENGPADGKSVGEVDRVLEQEDAQIIGMVRNGFRVPAPNIRRLLRAGDILVIEAEPESLNSILARLGLVLEEQVTGDIADNRSAREGEDLSAGGGESSKDDSSSGGESATEETVLREMVVMQSSGLIGRSASSVRLRNLYGLNLLAISRSGRRSVRRLRSTLIKAGDVLLMNGPPDALTGFGREFSCAPLAARSISIPDGSKAVAAVTIMALAISGAAFGLLPAAISFAFGVLLFMVLKVFPLHRVYEAIDWPVVVLLGALIPVALAMESTGAADLLARSLLGGVAPGQPVIALVLVLVVTMTLSDFMNNAATAAVMCPIAISGATHFGVNTDTFLMAVAIGASCAFLTPIGHQNNTLILGPGGFRFRDYWRLGLMMEIVVVAAGVPMLLIAWPL